MQFTYSSYENLLKLLLRNGYRFSNYHDYNNYKRPVILRHDIDFDLKKAVILAELENLLGVNSTYFVLLTSNFYNILSGESIELINRIRDLGHGIGLHFDETQYGLLNNGVHFGEHVNNELDIMQKALGVTVKCLSMHRPSRFTLENDLKFKGVVNSYSKEFFKDFKYISDSRMCWREDIVETITSRMYERLHILTHPFWYSKHEESIKNKLLTFITDAKKERFLSIEDNFYNLQEFIEPEGL